MEGTPRTSPAPVRYLDLDAAAANGIPHPDWIVEGWLEKQDIALLAGPAGVGKSTTAADLALAIATGTPWCGITTSGPRKVLYFDEESGEPEATRLLLRLRNGRNLATKPSTFEVAVGQGISLSTDDGLARLEQEIRAQEPDVVMLDSVQQVFQVEENSAADVGRVFGRLFKLRDSHGVTFLLIHHQRKTLANGHNDALESVRGSTAFATQCSTVWTVRHATSEAIKLQQVKRRGGRKRSLIIRYNAVDDDSPIILSGEREAREAETALAKAERFIVELLAMHSGARTNELLKAGRSVGLRKGTLERALMQLKGTCAIYKAGHLWHLPSGPGLPPGSVGNGAQPPAFANPPHFTQSPMRQDSP